MKRRKNILVTGLIVAAVTVAGVSAYAAEDVIDDTKEVVEGVLGRGPQGGQRGEGQKAGKGFDKAVEEGILTEAEAEAIEAYREANRPDVEAIREELGEDVTRDEFKAYMEENYPRPEDPHAELVSLGLITQDQADALDELRAEFEANCPEDAGRGFGGRGEGIGSENGRGRGQGGRGREPQEDQI